MKRGATGELARAVGRFFQEFLPAQRGMSLHTIRSYRDSLLLLFRFLADGRDERIAVLSLRDITAEVIVRVLAHLEDVRGNSINTRNARLAAIHTFARFLMSRHPEHMADLQAVLALPFKRGAQRHPVDYLELKEVEALLTKIDRSSPAGQRDYALFALMLNTGGRVQEVLNLTVRDVRFESPPQVRFVGKGNKVRLCPIWPRTAKLLEALIATHRRPTSDDRTETKIFQNQRGEPLSRFGVRYLLRKHLPDRSSGGSRCGKRIHPHALRHTTAVYLLKAGVDFATISQWLGHASLTTTMRYARADLDLKRQALLQVFPETLGAPTAGRLRIDGSEFTRWLRRL
jgi:site-specific recombinase XerD